jgi:hypothetical protein
MKTILRNAACLAVVALTGASLLAADGVVITQRMTTGGVTDTNTVQIIKDKMRVDVSSAGQSKQVIVFDATRGAISIISPERRTYMELTKEQIDQMAGMMRGMMAQAEAAMANMTPAQRAQMQGMMGGRGAAAGPKVEFRKTGTDRVGQWTCDKYEGTRNGQKVVEHCTVAPSALGLTAADTAVMQQLADMAKSMTSMVSEATGLLDIGRMDEQGFAGLPVKTVTTEGGREVISELASVARQSIADSLFDVPAGFQKQDIMGGMMGGRGRQ